MANFTGAISNISNKKKLQRNNQDFHFENENVCFVLNQSGDKKVKTFYSDPIMGITVSLIGSNIITNSESIDIQDLVKAYQTNILQAYCKNLNLVFGIFIHDEVKNKITLITDRLGLLPIYYKAKSDVVYFASDVKDFKKLKSNHISINRDGVNCFIDQGMLIGELEWFSDITRIPPATILTIDTNSLEIKSNRYWTWSDIQLNTCISFEDSLIGLKEVIDQVIIEEAPSNLLHGLSGGYDSRLLLGLLDEKIHSCYIFSTDHSHEYYKADVISKLFYKNLNLLELNDDNWFSGRVSAIWRSNATSSFKDLHGAQFLEELSARNLIGTNGLMADTLLGGTYLKNENRRISQERVKQKYGKWSRFCDINNEFFNIPREDAFLIDVRVRKCIMQGLWSISDELKQYVPFLDNRIIEFIYSIPDEYRLDRKLYFAFYRKYYPELLIEQYYGNASKQFKERTLTDSIIRKLKLGYRTKVKGGTNSFHQNNKWISHKSAFFTKFLNRKDSMYRDFLDQELDLSYVSKDFKTLSNLVTVEIWLNQIMENRFMTDDEFLNFDK